MSKLIQAIGMIVFFCATLSLLSASITLAFDTSPTTFTKITSVLAAIAIALGGSVIFAYAKEANLFESLLLMLFGLILFFTEINTQFGGYSVSDAKYKEISTEQENQDKQAEIQRQKLKLFENVADKPTLIMDLNKAEMKLIESKKIVCKSDKVCKADKKESIAKLESQIKLINSQIELSEKRVNELSKAESSIIESESRDYLKLHPHFIATSELLFGTPAKASEAKNLIRSVQAFAVVLLSYLGLRMANLNHYSHEKKLHDFPITIKNPNEPTTQANEPTTQANEPTTQSNEPTKVVDFPTNHANVISTDKSVGKVLFGSFVCEECGVETEKKRSNQRFCSDKCRMKWHGFNLKKSV